jgi:anthranilate synthase component I
MLDIFPTQADFEKSFQAGKSYLFAAEIAMSEFNHIAICRELKQQNSHLFLLQSAEKAGERSRFSVVATDPDLIYEAGSKSATIKDISGKVMQEKADQVELLREFKEMLLESQLPKTYPSMANALFGYLTYDAIRFVEKTIPDNNPDPIAIPLARFIRARKVIIYDRQKNLVYIIIRAAAAEAGGLHQQAQQQIYKLLQLINAANKNSSQQENIAKRRQNPSEFRPEMSKEKFKAMVEKCQEYIKAGDAFQIVPSQRFVADFSADPLEFYDNLSKANPSPYMFYVDFPDFQLIGASPEIMVRLQSGEVTIRPLAGTRKRGRDKQEDQALARNLLNDPKEIAEHLMLIDLSRNDVARIAESGTVKVTEKMQVEYYSHVMHISSNVAGRLAPGLDALDALFSALPVGTVSGAPKVRAMQIIDELESSKRSFYAGAVAYLAADGNMDSCIILRSCLLKDGKIYAQTGAGIVADSSPEQEYEETMNKVRIIRHTIKNC